eukprot:gene7469-611_t
MLQQPSYRFGTQTRRPQVGRVANNRPCRLVAAEAAKDAVYDTVIVGAGISGLVTAQALKSKHNMNNFLVTEARERVGGNITSLEADGYVWEEGPNSFQPSDAILQAAVDAGCEKDLVLGDPTAPRFVYWENKLRATPTGLDALTFTLLTPLGKIRAGLGAIGLFNAPPPGQEESVEQFIRRNLGKEVFERLIEPFCSGVYAGNPAKLSMKAAFGKIWILEQKGGSLVGGAIQMFLEKKNKDKLNPPPPRNPALPPKPAGQTVGSFRKGLKMLPEAIAKNCAEAIRKGSKMLPEAEAKNVSDAATAADGLYALTYDTPEGVVEIKTKTVSMTPPSYIVADLFDSHSPEAAEALRSFDYPPVAAVTLSYPNDVVREDRKKPDGSVPGFGQLHPRTQGVTTLGTIYSSSLFPGRAPDGSMLILNYIGGSTNRGIVNQSKEELAAQVDSDLRIMLIKPDAPPGKVIGIRTWPRAIPQFNVGHGDTLEKAKTAINVKLGWDGIFLGGNYVSGVALGKCVEYGYDFADSIAKKVAASPAAAKAVAQPVA